MTETSGLIMRVGHEAGVVGVDVDDDVGFAGEKRSDCVNNKRFLLGGKAEFGHIDTSLINKFDTELFH